MMPLLKDPIVDRWVLIAPERAARPGAIVSTPARTDPAHCPFCPGHESETPPELWADRTNDVPDTPGWRVRVFANKFPAIEGAHEVIVDTPAHDARLPTLAVPDVTRALDAYRTRLRALIARPDTRHAQLFRNEGAMAGATQSHPHAQVLALPIVPKGLRDELRGAEAVHAQRGCCAFCALLESEGAEDRLVTESRDHVAFAPPAPRMPYETWILPRAHESRLGDGDLTDLAACLSETARRVDAVEPGAATTLFLHEAPRAARVDASYHWHLELLPRTSGIAGFELSSGVYINALGPESAARALRAASPDGRA